MMTPAASLARRFYIVLFFCFLVGALVWGTFAARKAGDRLEERSRAFLEAGAARVDEILGASADRQADLMDRAVSRLSANLDREFADVPFDVFRDREDLLLEYLRERLDQARERQRANTALIADIFREEARDRAFHAFEGLVTDQERQVGELADRLSRDLLVWGGAFLLGYRVLPERDERGRTYMLYSVGFDGEDNGGALPTENTYDALRAGYPDTDYVLTEPNR